MTEEIIEDKLNASEVVILTTAVSFCAIHRNSAMFHAKKCKGLENSYSVENRNLQVVEHRAFAIAGLFSAFAYMETSVNSLLSDLTSEHPATYLNTKYPTLYTKFSSEIQELKQHKRILRMPIMEKLKLIYDILGTGYDATSCLMKRIDSLRLLRNTIVHREPEYTDDELAGEVDSLSGDVRNQLGEFRAEEKYKSIMPYLPNVSKSNPFYLDQTGIEITNVLCKDLVELAVNTADELSGEVCSFLGIKPCIDMSC